jgi:hypothetical protein
MATIRQQRVATTVATRRMVLKGLCAAELGHLKRRQLDPTPKKEEGWRCGPALSPKLFASSIFKSPGP